jgi:hypothetical protein
MIHNESFAITGNAAVGEVGSVAPVISVALTSVTASGLVSAVDYAQVAPLTTDSAEGFVGSVGPVVTVALSGVSASGSVGTIIPVYWILVDDSQTPNWQNVNDSQSSSWALVHNAETSNWALVETD